MQASNAEEAHCCDGPAISLKTTMGMSLLLMTALLTSRAEIEEILRLPWRNWALEEAVRVLNDSPWARQVTFAQVVAEVGSGVRGEKEILNTFYIRLLSARPVRQALARVEQINRGYDRLSPPDRDRFDRLLEAGLELDASRWIVVTVGFRSNDSERENQILSFLRTETAQTLKNQAILSTNRFPRVELKAYYPPAGDGIGARFVFPRYSDGTEIFEDQRDTLLFQLEIPDLGTPLTVEFPLREMEIDGELIL